MLDLCNKVYEYLSLYVKMIISTLCLWRFIYQGYFLQKHVPLTQTNTIYMYVCRYVYVSTNMPFSIFMRVFLHTWESRNKKYTESACTTYVICDIYIYI